VTAQRKAGTRLRYKKLLSAATGYVGTKLLNGRGSLAIKLFNLLAYSLRFSEFVRREAYEPLASDFSAKPRKR